MYSDGVTEAMDKKYEEYGEERFQSCILKNASLDAGKLKSQIIQDIQGFVGSEPQSDDLTLMVARRMPG